MNEEAIQFLIQHGYALLFGWVLVEQIGLPIPAIPLLLAAGALAGSGRMNFTLAMALVIIAVLAADMFWYYLGRYRGSRILKLLCRISLEPDACVRRTEDVFVRHGALSLLIAKFVPGLNTAAPALAGIFRMPVLRFIVFDGLGAFFWVATFTGLGYLFSDQLDSSLSPALGQFVSDSSNRKFGSLRPVEVCPAQAFSASPANCTYQSQRANGKTRRRE